MRSSASLLFIFVVLYVFSFFFFGLFVLNMFVCLFLFLDMKKKVILLTTYEPFSALFLSVNTYFIHTLCIFLLKRILFKYYVKTKISLTFVKTIMYFSILLYMLYIQVFKMICKNNNTRSDYLSTYY